LQIAPACTGGGLGLGRLRLGLDWHLCSRVAAGLMHGYRAAQPRPCLPMSAPKTREGTKAAAPNAGIMHHMNSTAEMLKKLSIAKWAPMGEWRGRLPSWRGRLAVGGGEQLSIWLAAFRP
jgi:hypothetical protein